MTFSFANNTFTRRVCIDPMKGLDVEAFVRVYIEGNEDPMKDYETVKEAIELEEQTKAAIAAQMEQMQAMKGTENKKEAKKRRKEEAKRNKQEAKTLRKSRAKN
jgi:hypothetical protein